ncbi:MAG: hypothetical protein C4523_09565 [Myxococcales bacterium]|nr:MAG: hypothetical protein C4523_09565 [Myxococcales bacterium]
MQRKWLAVILAFSAALVALACESKDSTTEADGDGFVPTDGDLPDGDLTGGDGLPDTDGDGSGSDGDSIIIIPPDGDQEEGPEPECLQDLDCAGTDYCDTTYNVCRRRKELCEPCATSLECGTTDSACLANGICGRWCDQSYVCPENFNCEAATGAQYNQCVWDSAISNVPQGGNCCLHTDCVAPLTCHPLTHKCNEGCTAASACPPGMVCFDDTSDDRNGFCTEGCLINQDCKGGEVCFNGQCVVGDCATKADCPLEYKCDTSTFSCYPGCDTDGDCYGSNECIGGLCVKRVGCEGTWQCSLNQMCTVELPDGDPEDRGCCYDGRLESTAECQNPNPQPFCMPCSEATSDNTECGGENKCVQLVDQDENPLGNFCLIKWDCTVRDGDGLHQGTQECPRGYTCANIKEGDLAGKWCMASCFLPEYEYPGR